MKHVNGWITFTKDNVLSVMRDDKTTTRRVISPQPQMDEHGIITKNGFYRWPFEQFKEVAARYHARHKAGDILGVKEGYQITNVTGKANGIIGRYLADDVPFRVNLNDAEATRFGMRKYPTRAMPGMFMYKSLTRTFIEILSVRVERIQDITEADAQAEGVAYPGWDPQKRINSWVLNFRVPWNSINKKRGFGWDVNPWVFAYGFERLTE